MATIFLKICISIQKAHLPVFKISTKYINSNHNLIKYYYLYMKFRISCNLNNWVKKTLDIYRYWKFITERSNGKKYTKIWCRYLVTYTRLHYGTLLMHCLRFYLINNVFAFIRTQIWKACIWAKSSTSNFKNFRFIPKCLVSNRKKTSFLIGNYGC